MNIDLDKFLSTARIVPVLTVPASADPAALAAPLAQALAEAGITAVEVTLRTPGSERVIQALAEHSRLAVGAGTVLTPGQATLAQRAGAQFLVSPGIDEDVLERGRELGLPVIPGVATATEVMRAMRLGLGTFKLFPAGKIGGPGIVTALSGPFPEARFMPTGGIGPDQLRAYLTLPQVLAVGGSWIAPLDLLERGEFREIQERAAHAVKAAAP